MKSIGCPWKPPATYTYTRIIRLDLEGSGLFFESHFIYARLFFLISNLALHWKLSFIISSQVYARACVCACVRIECENLQMHAISLVLRYVQSTAPFRLPSTHIRKWAHYFDWFWIRLIMPSGTALIQYQTNYFLFVPHTIFYYA